MNRKTTLLLVGVLLALVGAYFAFVHKWNGPDNEFHITDAKAVGKVVIETMAMNASDSRVELQLQGDEWTVNGKYTANEAKMKDFLTTLQEIRVLQPVEPKAQETALSLLKRNHIHVTIWDRDGKEMKDYLIGATNNTQTANIFKMGFSDNCYLVSKPALEGYVSVYYSSHEMDWREKLVWNVKGADLEGITVTYAPDSLQQSYSLQKNGSEWLLDGGIKAEPNRVGGYTGLFEGKVFAESFADAAYPGMLDSLLLKTPQARIQLRPHGLPEVDLRLFVRQDNANSFFGFLADRKELLTVQHFVIDKFLKSRNFFMPAVQ